MCAALECEVRSGAKQDHEQQNGGREECFRPDRSIQQESYERWIIAASCWTSEDSEAIDSDTHEVGTHLLDVVDFSSILLVMGLGDLCRNFDRYPGNCIRRQLGIGGSDRPGAG